MTEPGIVAARNDYLQRLLEKERLQSKAHDYLSYHKSRFQYVFQKCISLKPDPSTRVLDIGRSHLSSLLLSHYNEVSTLGFPLSATEQFGHESGSTLANDRRSFSGHIVFDLNASQVAEKIDVQQRYDLIVFAEVLEHLYTAPELVLRMLAGLLTKDGILICQTPNALALHKRIMPWLGIHPYERIRIDHTNPGHFREYTKKELVEIARTAGLKTAQHEFVDYFAVPKKFAPALAVRLLKLAGVIKPSLRRGQTTIFVADPTSNP